LDIKKTNEDNVDQVVICYPPETYNWRY